MKKTRKAPLRKPGRMIDETLNPDLPPMFWLATDGEVQIQRDLGCFVADERDAWLPVALANRKTEKMETREELELLRVGLCGQSPLHSEKWYYRPTIDEMDPEVQANPLSKLRRESLRLAQFQVEARRALLKLRAIEEVKRKRKEDAADILETREGVRNVFRAIFEGMRAKAAHVNDQKTVDAISNDLEKMVDEILPPKTQAAIEDELKKKDTPQ